MLHSNLLTVRSLSISLQESRKEKKGAVSFVTILK